MTTKTIPGVAGHRYIVRDASGEALGEGDIVKTFRGEEAQLISISAAPVPGKSAKVTTTLGTHYETVYGLSVTIVPTIAQVTEALDMLSLAAKSDDHAGYRAALDDARRIGVTDDQIRDAYRWGRRGRGGAFFDYQGQTPDRPEWATVCAWVDAGKPALRTEGGDAIAENA